MDVAGFESSLKWSADVFGASKLGDKRLEQRLIKYAAAQAASPRASTAAACGSRKADREGAYRLLENERVNATDIDQGPWKHCIEACTGRRQLLAIQDTTSVRVHHRALAESMQASGSPTGYVVHTLMLVDGEDCQPLGIAHQERWRRDKGRARKTKYKDRASRDKESFKWQRALEALGDRLPAETQVISVCDREADIYELLLFHQLSQLDFVIRASWNRRTTDELGHVFDAVTEAPVIMQRPRRIEQRGATSSRSGRPRRDIVTDIRATAVCLRPPGNRTTDGLEQLHVNVVRVSEVGSESDESGLQWFLLTTLPIDTTADVEQIVQIYERRWLIEEFHKCWKTGCRLESRPLQSFDAVQRMMAMTAPIGIRLLQLQLAATDPDADIQPTMLDEDQWHCLWQCTSTEPLPDLRPSAQWAYRAIAKLGGWYDSKGTGRAGWQTLWQGWASLLLRLDGWRAARRSLKK